MGRGKLEYYKKRKIEVSYAMLHSNQTYNELSDCENE